MTIQCPECQHENPDTLKFCGECGTQLLPKDIDVTKTAETPKQELATGATFANRYQIIEELGKGGMGRVYKSYDTKINEKIALKLIKPEIASDKKTIQRFSNELKFARKIRHKNICQMFDLGEYRGKHFITMEYVEGQDLKRMIRQSGQLALSTILHIIKQVCDGLMEAHSSGIIHRDLKPNNIMIDADGNVRIMDFGISRCLKTKGITGDGMMMGTPEYMSPEQTEAKEVDERTDIYSLGVILYEMTTGHLPFTGETPISLAMKHKGEMPQNPQDLNAHIPVDLSDLILKCLEKNRDKRYQSVEELLTDLKAVQKEIPEATFGPVPRKSTTTRVSLYRRPKAWMPGMAMFLLILAIAGFYFVLRWDKPVLPSEKIMLVVLPFDNLGPPEDDYFADGVTEEITSRLASSGSLAVISRHSAIQYKQTDKTIKQIGSELNVDYVLEGTVSWDRSIGDRGRVRITPKLIRVADDTHVWAKVYEEELEGIFTVQTRVAGQVIDQLNITLLTDRLKDAAVPTENMDAYQAYLKGLHLTSQEMYSDRTRQLEVQMFQQAVDLDPSFALAYARLSRSHSNLVNLGYDTSKARIKQAKNAVDQALELQPDLAEAQLALGYYHYYCRRDYNMALQIFSRLESRLPNEVDILLPIASILRRMGEWEQSVDYYNQALTLSPRDALLLGELGVNLINMRRYAEALEYLDQSIALAPDNSSSYFYKVLAYFDGLGDLVQSRAILESMPRSEAPIYMYFWYLQHLYERNYREALIVIDSLPLEIIRSQVEVINKQQMRGLVYYLMGEEKRSREAYNAALPFFLEEAEKSPDDFRLQMALGIIYAGLGDKKKAIEYGERGVELLPVSKNALHGSAQVVLLAQIYTMVGEYNAALNRLEYLLSITCPYSVDYFKIDPVLAPLSKHTGYQRLLKRAR